MPKTLSSAHRANISKSNKGRIFSPEHRQKLAEAAKHTRNARGNKSRPAQWVIIAPDGTKTHICGLKAYCDANNWNYSTIKKYISQGKKYRGHEIIKKGE